jgi:hypothetical protein
MALMQLKRLGPEPWGRRLERARGKATFTEVQEILFPHISRSSLFRLEAFQDVPTARKDRARAALVLMLYGYNLEDFGLTEADIPPAMDMKVLERLRRSSTKWFTTCPPIASLAVAA